MDGIDAWITAAVTLLVAALLCFTSLAADAIFVLGLIGLLMGGVLTVEDALAGFANPAVATIGVLYVVATALQETGAVYWVSARLLGRPRSAAGAQLRLMAPVTLFSAFLNNTPVVAMLIPAVRDWARRLGMAPSKLMIPLSYAAIAGGMCTLIGTSTNLVVNGMLIEHDRPALGMLEPAWIGVPIAATVIGFILLTSRFLLPDRQTLTGQLDDPREYSIEMTVSPNGPLVGQTIAQAGLRQLGSVYLVEIDRRGQILPAVSPTDVLESGDRLVFVGVVDSVVDLQRIHGLLPATDQVFKLDGPRSQRLLFEAVVSNNNPLIGRSIRKGRFRNHYDAVVIALARNGERIKQKLGDIVLHPGDTLVLEARPSFAERLRNSRDFYLVSRIEDSHPPRFDRAWITVGLLAAMVASVALGWLDMLRATLLTAGLLVVLRCTSVRAARRSIDWMVLITIAAALGLGRALEQTGVAHTMAEALLGLAGNRPTLTLFILYLTTALISAVVTNNAAAVLMFPVAWATADELGTSFMPFAIAIMVAASASFATPIGYQTNLMVYGPGGYHFRDYLRIGLPLTAVSAVIAALWIPLVWQLYP
ncbi:MAG: SLC13 family permease [Proteobacteria bacterium]|nr:SLC13 family permease [Pseudomonadota bacterium]